MTRLNTNGTFDTSFNGSGKFMLSLSQAGITFNSQATAITTLSNGSLLVGGTAFEQNSLHQQRVRDAGAVDLRRHS